MIHRWNVNESSRQQRRITDKEITKTVKGAILTTKYDIFILYFTVLSAAYINKIGNLEANGFSLRKLQKNGNDCWASLLQIWRCDQKFLRLWRTAYIPDLPSTLLSMNFAAASVSSTILYIVILRIILRTRQSDVNDALNIIETSIFWNILSSNHYPP